MKFFGLIICLNMLCSSYAWCVPMQIDVESLEKKIVSGVTEIREKLTAKVDREFSINLESNPTTGFRWRLDLQMFEAVVCAVDQKYVRSTLNSNQNVVGRGGLETWTFKTTHPGQASIILEYLRPWESGNKPVRRVVIEVDVEPVE